MRSGLHYDHNQTKCLTTGKVTARIMFAVAEAHKWKLEHMDTCNEYFNEQAQYEQPVFLCEMPSRNGTYKHGQAMGQLRHNLWRGKSAGHKYTEEIFRYLKENVLKQTEVYPCLLYEKGKKGPTIITIAVD